MKSALVTGAASGIGQALALDFANRDYIVFACDVNSCEHLNHKNIIPIHCDITNLADIQATSQLVNQKTGGKLDVLYNNAGIGDGGAGVYMPEKSVSKIFDVNVIGHINMTKHMIDYIIAARGTIVYTASVAARLPLGWISIYCATKSAIDMYAKSIHRELAPFGVRVHSVITGAVRTPIGGDSSNDADERVSATYNIDGYKESMEACRHMATPPDAEEPSDYARGVIDMITSKKDPGFNLYKGRRARISHYLSMFMPLCVIDYLMARAFKQSLLFSNIRKLVAKQKSE